MKKREEKITLLKKREERRMERRITSLEDNHICLNRITGVTKRHQSSRGTTQFRVGTPAYPCRHVLGGAAKVEDTNTK